MLPGQVSDVCTWHFCDMPTVSANVRFDCGIGFIARPEADVVGPNNRGNSGCYGHDALGQCFFSVP